MPKTCICMMIYGKSPYHAMGRYAVSSILARTDLEAFLAVESGRRARVGLKKPWRLTVSEVLPSRNGHRASPFLLKFSALQACLEHSAADRVLLLDADTVLVADLNENDIDQALGGHDFAMVEQSTIIGSSLSRQAFLSHYRKHTLVWFKNPGHCPPLDEFRYYNSGVVIGTRSAFRSFNEWALAEVAGGNGSHQIGEHMIADQDYFQYWTNTLNPGCCTDLPWTWNHCRHWDHGFPKPAARILHFSNFCHGPSRLQPWKNRYFELLLGLKRFLTRP